MFLTQDEVRDLTGYQRHADQRRWLSDRGWVFEVSGTGRPVVSKNYANSRLCGSEVINEWKPNLAAIRKSA